MFATSRNETGLLVHVFECSEHSFGVRLEAFQGFLGLLLVELSVFTGSFGEVIASGLSIGFVHVTPLDSAAKSEFSLSSIDVSATVGVDQVEDSLRVLFSGSLLL